MAYDSENLTAEQIVELEQFFNIKLPDRSNSLYAEIKEILHWSKRIIPEYGEKASWFESPISEEEIVEWEKSNDIAIPESYKDWLRFSRDSQIRNTLAHFNSPNGFELNNPGMPEDLVAIGWLIGDGERLCLSKKAGKIVRFYGQKSKEFDNLKPIVHEVIRMIKGESGISKKSEDLLLEMVAANKKNLTTDSSSGHRDL